MNHSALLIKDKESELIAQTALECAGYGCETFTTTQALLRGLKREDLALIVIDVDTEACDWKAVLDWRRNWLNPSVLVILIGNPDGRAAALALGAGADDFVAKPLRGPELLARLKAAHTRQSNLSRPQLHAVAGCVVDRNSCSLKSPRAQVALTARELAVAQLMFKHAGEVVSRRRLAIDVWGSDEELTARSIEQHIYQLRRKLKRCVGEALALRGVYGSGYRLDDLTEVATEVAAAA